jgi:hypothetical protein|nr:MAG TPA: hypothetical protein [Caudoviricetes sp.]
MAYPIQKFRTLFEIATDVKDNKIEKAFFEADLLDILPQVGAMYDAIPDEYIADGADFAGAEKVLCYYAFARYLQIADQNSTTTGMKIQTYGGSVVVPDTSKVKRFEAERSKADLFLEPLICRMKKDGFIKVCVVQNSRIGLIR